MTLSSFLAGEDWGITKNTSNPGEIIVSLYSTDQGALGTGTPQLLNLNFHVASNAAAGTVPIGVTTTGAQKGFNEGQLVMTPSPGSVVIPASVANEYIFYNNSKFDSNNPAANASDYGAIATDKSALLPGNTATFANYTSYSRGINGILVDFANLPTNTVLTASDFQFEVGNNSTPPTGWTAAPAPQAVATWTGPNGDLFADITWADNAIQDKWLQVTVKADANTQLTASKVFYFGNEIGDVGLNNTTSKVTVSAADVAGVQGNPATSIHPAPITDVYDINRDGKVDASDVALAQSNINSSLSPTALNLISPPATPSMLAMVSGSAEVASSTDSSGSTAVTTSVASAQPAAILPVATSTSVVTANGPTTSDDAVISAVVTVPGAMLRQDQPPAKPALRRLWPRRHWPRRSKRSRRT